RHPPVRSFNQPTTEFSEMMNIADLFVLEAWMKKTRGDWTGAGQSYLDLIRFGEDLSRGSPLLGRLVSVAVTFKGTTRLVEIIDQLSAAAAKPAAQEVLQILGRHCPMAETLEEEKRTIQASLLDLFRKPNWRLPLVTPDGIGLLKPDEQPSLWEKFVRFAITFPYTKQEVMDAYTRYMDGWISHLSLP